MKRKQDTCRPWLSMPATTRFQTHLLGSDIGDRSIVERRAVRPSPPPSYCNLCPSHRPPARLPPPSRWARVREISGGSGSAAPLILRRDRCARIAASYSTNQRMIIFSHHGSHTQASKGCHKKAAFPAREFCTASRTKSIKAFETSRGDGEASCPFP